MLIFPIMFLLTLLLLVGGSMFFHTTAGCGKARRRRDGKNDHQKSLRLGISSFFQETVVPAYFLSFHGLRRKKLPCRVVKNSEGDRCALNFPPSAARCDSLTEDIPHCSENFQE